MIRTYRMPAEWEPHQATWLAWPHNKEHWPGKFEPIPAVFAEMAHALVQGGEKVFICVNDAAMEEEARRVIERALPACLPSGAVVRHGRQAVKQSSTGHDDGFFKNIRFFRISTDSSWMRDTGPIFVADQNGQLVITNWIFNSWGEKYPPWDLDNKVSAGIARALKVPAVSPGMVLEGGSIEVNGKGALLTTEQCLLNKNRNPHLSRAQIEKNLRVFFGVTNILWLKEGIFGDETDGHVDEVARFTDAHTLVANIEENAADPNHKILKKNFEDLEKMRDQNGRPFRIIQLPLPSPVMHKHQRLPVSYTNFYIANTAVLIPTFRCKQDEQALKILQELFPGRRIIGIDCVDLAWGLGAIHCSTQQQPYL